MVIKLTDHLRPFSHIPGTFVILPKSHFALKIYPDLIEVFDVEGTEPKMIDQIGLSIVGPVKDFTIELDLKKGLIKVWGHSPNQFWRYRIYWDGKIHYITEKGLLPFPSKKGIVPTLFSEQMSLGCNKKINWLYVKSRLDLREIIPLWLQLDLMVPSYKINSYENTLLQEVALEIEAKNKNKIIDALQNVFLAGFEDIFVPRIKDNEFQGFPKKPLNEINTPLLLIKEGAALIRSLFFKEMNDQLFFLPLLPSLFVCGKWVNRKTNWGNLSFEWTKGKIRRITLQSICDQRIYLHFPKEIKRCQIREINKQKGTIHTCPAYVDMLKGKNYLIDNFES